MTKPSPGAPRFVKSGVPLYYQLSTLLREQIASGAYAPGDQLPTEAALVREYGISRITVRQALKCLEEDELIRRQAGRGTFVTDQAHSPGGFQMNGSLDDLISLGLNTTVKLLDLREVVACEEDAAALGTRVGNPIVQATRLRYYRDAPYSYIINRLPREIAASLTDHDWKAGAILQAIETRLGLRLRDADQSVRATVADATLAGLLETRIGAPILSVDRVVRIEDGRAVARLRTDYRGDMYSIKVRLTRAPEQVSPAASWRIKNPSSST